MEYLRITAQGRLGTPGVEIFQFGLNVAEHGADWAVALAGTFGNNTLMSDIADDVKDFFGRPTSLINPRAHLESVKIAHVVSAPVPGNPLRMAYASDPKIFPRAQPGQGFSTIPSTLPQAALVASLNTETRGPTGRGRFYVPMPTHGLGEDFTLPVAQADAFRDSVVTMIRAINDEPGIDDLNNVKVSVISMGSVARGLAPRASTVTSVRVGRVVDTVRSRRASLSEKYTAPLNIVV